MAKGRTRHSTDRGWRRLGLIVGAVVLALAVNVWCIEPTALGKRLRRSTYDYIQYRLSTAHTTRLPVVIDSSGLSETPVTDRQVLMDLLDTLVIKQDPRHRPAAIGFDIDFSPGEQGVLRSERDAEFFERCLRCQELGVPVVLGIQRSAALAPDEWLGLERYRPLAASILVPKPSTQTFALWTEVDGNVRCPTLAAALAGASAGEAREPSRALAWAIELERSGASSANVRTSEFLVDYGPLETIEADRIPYAKVLDGSVSASLLDRRIVLVGDAARRGPTDLFVVPDRQEPFPGVLLHACAVATLTAHPLYGLTHAGRIALDVLLVALVSGGVWVLQFVARRRAQPAGHRERAARESRDHRAITAGVVVVMFIGGVVFVTVTRIVWDDFVFAAIGLAVHRPLEHVLSKAVGKAQGVFSRRSKGSKRSAKP